MPDVPIFDDENFNPRKAGSQQGGNPPRGGGSPGPGGGFGGGFGGTGFFGSLEGGSAGDLSGRPKRKVVMGPNGPISLAYSPMVADTVPAMLSPGEGVLNNGAMAQPGMEEFLNNANQRGMQHMAGGGVVPGGGGEDIRSLLMALLPILLGLNGGGMDSEGEGDAPQHFAFGGVARQQGGFSPRPAPKFSGVTGGRFGAPPTMAPAPAAPPMTMGPGAPGSTYDWTGNPLAGGRTPNSPGGGMLGDIINQFGKNGAFDPNGSPQLLDALRSEATGNADALRRRAATNADVNGLDAGQRGAYAMQSDLNTQGGVANILNSAKLGQLQSQDKFGKDQMAALQQFLYNYWQSQQDYEHQSKRPGGIG